MAKFLDISDATMIIVSPDPTGVNNRVGIRKDDIETVNGVYTAKPASTTNPSTVPGSADKDSNYWIYPYPTRTFVNIILKSGRREGIELQDLVIFTGGTAGWAAGTQAALNTAVNDINASL